MATLRARIDREKQTVTFSGPGTFQAKEAIKELPAARWQNADKVWVASSAGVTVDILEKKFPDIVVEQIGDISDDVNNALEENAEVVPETDRKQALSVSELISRIRSALTSAFPGTVLIKGVISKVSSPKHLYIELADHDRRSDHVSCFMWQNDIERVCKNMFEKGFELEADLDVMFEVSVGLNPRRSSVSLEIRNIIVEYTIGKLAAEREKTNERLKKEGLFELNKATSLTFLPTKLGVITSAGGTVINDFRASLDSANFGFQLCWFKANVQGQGAKKQILEGIRVLSKIPDIDAILIFRGGGSPAELAIFNDYDVAREVCLCKFPVISAIGHQEDQCSVQDVSFRAEGVPKDVGHFFASFVEDLRMRCGNNISLIMDKAGQIFALTETSLCNVGAHVVRACEHIVLLREESVSGYRISLPSMARAFQARAFEQLNDVARPISALSSGVMNEASRELVRRLSSINITGMSRVEVASQKVLSVTERLIGESQRLWESISVRLRGIINIPTLASHVVRVGELELDKHEKLIEVMAPDVQLKRGFVLVRRKCDLSYVTSGAKLESQDEVEMQFHDIVVGAKVS